MKYNVLKMEDALEALIDYRGKTPEKAEEGKNRLRRRRTLSCRYVGA